MVEGFMLKDEGAVFVVGATSTPEWSQRDEGVTSFRHCNLGQRM